MAGEGRYVASQLIFFLASSHCASDRLVRSGFEFEELQRGQRLEGKPCFAESIVISIHNYFEPGGGRLSISLFGQQDT